MVTKAEVQKQLSKIGAKVSFLGQRECHELSSIVVEGEIIKQCLVGFYNDAISLLCVTNLRVLVIDKRPLFLNIEDIRYEMISEVSFGGRLIDSSLTIHSIGKSFRFRSWHNSQLRLAYSMVQEMVLSAKKSDLQVNFGTTEIKNPIIWRKNISKYVRPIS